MLTQVTPRIYVACLAAYNSGHLHGKWIDANQSIEIIQEEINEILHTSPEQDAEEYAIHDSEFLGNISEYAGLNEIIERAEFIAEHGEVAIALLDHYHDLKDAMGAIDGYHGEYDSELDYAYRYVDETCMFENIPQTIQNYFDYESFARDLFINDLFSIEKDGSSGVYVFSNY